jgi:hypothetical protein
VQVQVRLRVPQVLAFVFLQFVLANHHHMFWLFVFELQYWLRLHSSLTVVAVRLVDQ